MYCTYYVSITKTYYKISPTSFNLSYSSYVKVTQLSVSKGFGLVYKNPSRKLLLILLTFWNCTNCHLSVSLTWQLTITSVFLFLWSMCIFWWFILLIYILIAVWNLEKISQNKLQCYLLRNKWRTFTKYWLHRAVSNHQVLSILFSNTGANGRDDFFDTFRRRCWDPWRIRTESICLCFLSVSD